MRPPPSSVTTLSSVTTSENSGVRLGLDLVLVGVTILVCRAFARTFTLDGFDAVLWAVVLLCILTVVVVDTLRFFHRRRHRYARLALLGLIAWLFFIAKLTSGMMFGTMAWMTTCPSTQNMAIGLVTVEKAIGRRDVFKSVAARLGLSYEEILGVDASELSGTAATLRAFGVFLANTPNNPIPLENSDVPLPHDSHRTTLSLLLNTREAMLGFVMSFPQPDWIVLLEDDARPFDWFEKYARQAMCEYADADVIWLNPVSSVYWFFLGRPFILTTGMMYRGASVSKIAGLLDFNSEFMRERRTRFVSASFHDEAIAIDRVLESACNEGKLKCAVVPLVQEWGFPSTLFATRLPLRTDG